LILFYFNNLFSYLKLNRVLVGNNFSIECVIAGWPKPIVEWEKYGDVLPEKRNEVLHGTLYLYDIRLDDRGTYICRSSSSNGQSDIAYTALLEVLGKEKGNDYVFKNKNFFFCRTTEDYSTTGFSHSDKSRRKCID
jgi:hypothetical protein